MKKFIKFPVIVFAVVLAASCGDSEKEPSLLDVAVSDAKAYMEFQCKIFKEMDETTWEDGEKLRKLREELDKEEEKMYKKYSSYDIPAYVKSAYRDQLKAEGRKGCDKEDADGK